MIAGHLLCVRSMLVKHRFIRHSVTENNHPSTDQCAGAGKICNLLTVVDAYTRCSRHIAESHKRVQKIVQLRMQNENIFICGASLQVSLACVVGH